jgi:hypothetical protein
MLAAVCGAHCLTIGQSAGHVQRLLLCHPSCRSTPVNAGVSELFKKHVLGQLGYLLLLLPCLLHAAAD